MNYISPLCTLLLVFFLQVAIAAPGKTAIPDNEIKRAHLVQDQKRNKKVQLTFGQQLALKIVTKKMQKQQAKPAKIKKVKATGRYKYGALSLICLFVGLLMLIVVPIISALGVGGAIIFGLMGLQRDADPSLARVSLIALGIITGLAAFLMLITLFRVGGGI